MELLILFFSSNQFIGIITSSNFWYYQCAYTSIIILINIFLRYFLKKEQDEALTIGYLFLLLIYMYVWSHTDGMLTFIQIIVLFIILNLIFKISLKLKLLILIICLAGVGIFQYQKYKHEEYLKSLPAPELNCKSGTIYVGDGIIDGSYTVCYDRNGKKVIDEVYD